jgi:hypothetical protein
MQTILNLQPYWTQVNQGFCDHKNLKNNLGQLALECNFMFNFIKEN